LIATAGNDAHSNIGVSVNDASGKQWLGVKLDPYERSFRVVRTHVLIKRARGDTRIVNGSDRVGHCYISFDIFGDPQGFVFASEGPDKRIMGDDLIFKDDARLTAAAPLRSRFVLLRNGSVIDERSGTSAEFHIATAAPIASSISRSLPRPLPVTLDRL